LEKKLTARRSVGGFLEVNGKERKEKGRWQKNGRFEGQRHEPGVWMLDRMPLNEYKSAGTSQSGKEIKDTGSLGAHRCHREDNKMGRGGSC